MRLPRDLSGDELAQRLIRYGYRVIRQTGSHMQLTTERGSTIHHVTIPRHSALRVGTLNNILRDVSGYLSIDKSELVNELFND